MGQKTDPVVMKETRFIALGVLVCSLLMQGVYVVLRLYSTRVLIGSVLGGLCAVANFYLLGRTVQSAAGAPQEEVSKKVRTSYTLRMFLMGLLLVVCMLAPGVDWVPAGISVLFPSFLIKARGIWEHFTQKDGGVGPDANSGTKE